MRSVFPRFSPENIAANAPIVEFLKQVAKRKNSTPAQVSPAWLLARKPWIVPIPGTCNVDHLLENLGAVDIELTRADLREIETALSGITVHGGRMNEQQMWISPPISRGVHCHIQHHVDFGFKAPLRYA
jgi:aryl-alcohol dehydrogenase-like predicted oxidoreductase